MELRWLGGHRGLEAGVIPATGIPFRRLLLRSLRSVDKDMHAILDPIRLALSLPQAVALMARHRPTVVFTTGGYVAMPALVAAWLLRVPAVMWDGNAVPGRSVRVTARLVGCLAVSFASACRALAKEDRCYLTGTPIRTAGAMTRAQGRAALGLPAEGDLLLIFGGSQAVRRFNGAVSAALPELVERVLVIHVTGDAGHETALRGRDLLPAGVRDRYRPERFLGDEMAAAFAAADLVVGRAGASTLAEAAAFGLPMVVVPYPHAAGHQRRNAEEAAAAGAARLVEDAAFDAAALLAAAAILDDPALRASMAAAARSLARPGAARAVARLVEAASRREPLPAAAEIDALARAGSRA